MSWALLGKNKSYCSKGDPISLKLIFMWELMAIFVKKNYQDILSFCASNQHHCPCVDSKQLPPLIVTFSTTTIIFYSSLEQKEKNHDTFTKLPRMGMCYLCHQL